MLLQLFVAATTSLSADSVAHAPIDMLGEPIEAPTYIAEERPVGGEPVRRTPFEFAGFPLDANAGVPLHLVGHPSEAGFTLDQLERALRAVEEEVYRGGFPGAAVAIGRWDRTVVERGIGTLDRILGSPPVDPDRTIYDLASLTKVVATTTAVMLLAEDGRIDLAAPVSRYLPAFSGGEKNRVNIRHLLTHTSGLPAGGNVWGTDPNEALARAIGTNLVTAPGEKVEYSDIGFIVLWAAAEAAHGAPLEDLLRQRIFEPLEMWSTGFKPGAHCYQCAPTDDRPGYRGVVHDPIARRLDGIAGHAGLFSTAHDLSRFAAMLANRGELEGVRVLERSTIEYFTMRQPNSGTRALGWDTPDDKGEGAGGLRISSSAFGHTGFTGTSLWIDPERGTWVVLLSNRTFKPSGPSRIQALRRELHDWVATSVDQSLR
jgi:serine-type D-Ala-D-Ala carboxypeptidase